MTLIRFNFEKPSASGEDVPNEGSLRLVPTMRRVVEGDPDVVILPAPFSVKVSGSLGLELAATGPGWVWDLRASGFGVSSWQEFLVVPEPVADPDRPGEFLPVDYPDLVRVDPATLEPSAEPDPAWWAELEAAKALASDVEAARVAAAGSAVEAGSARDDAVVAAGEASGFAGEAAGSASAAVAAAGTARTDADTATAQAGEAGLARTGAELARDATVAAAGGSEASAALAATAAVESAQSAADAEAAALDVVTRADNGEFKGDDGDPTAFELRGTGSPLGVVSAPPGTYYTDTAGTLGAWRWLKKTGTGTSGWEVVHGDTGWRDVSSLLANGWQGRVSLRRVNNLVELRLSEFNSGTATTNSFLHLPADFAPGPDPIYFMASASDPASANASMYLIGTAGSQGTVFRAPRGAFPGTGRASGAFTTSWAWPATLPGTPA